MEEAQELDDGRENKASRRFAEGRERLERMQLKSMGDFHKNQRDLQSQMELCKWMEEQHESWQRGREAWEREREDWQREREAWQREREAGQRERETTESELRKLRLQVTQLEADLEEKHNWNRSRQVLAPITPEAVKARMPFRKGVRGDGKENDEKGGEDVERLRREREHWKEKANRASKLYKGLQSQYNSVVGLKGSDGHLVSNHEQLQDALEAGLEKPSKIRRRSAGDTPTQGRDSRSSSPALNVPNSPAADFKFLPPQPVAEVVTGPTAPTSHTHSKVGAEPVHSESSKAIVQVPSTKDKIAGGLDMGPEGEPDEAIGTAAAITGSRKRSLEVSGKQAAKPPPFKFVDPVRKKAERENLQATECKLCKRFYDAVAAGSAEGLVEPRCNHLEKSRHRFRDLPPETPEGFWDIGFDTQF